MFCETSRGLILILTDSGWSSSGAILPLLTVSTYLSRSCLRHPRVTSPKMGINSTLPSRRIPFPSDSTLDFPSTLTQSGSPRTLPQGPSERKPFTSKIPRLVWLLHLSFLYRRSLKKTPSWAGKVMDRNLLWKRWIDKAHSATSQDRCLRT